VPEYQRQNHIAKGGIAAPSRKIRSWIWEMLQPALLDAMPKVEEEFLPADGFEGIDKPRGRVSN